MNGNHFGTIFQITTWGESHGPASGVVVDGCPSGLPLSAEDFTADLLLRQGGNSSFTTPRKESDLVAIESGVFEGKTTGTPISLRIEHSNKNSNDYDAYRDTPRPGHADLTTHLKHGHRDHRGGGRSSARETTARVAAGVIAKRLLALYGVQMVAWVSRVGEEAISGDFSSPKISSLAQLRASNPLGAPLPAEATKALEAKLDALRDKKDSLGGAVRVRVDDLPPGLGEPIFDKLNAVLSHGFFSLPAVTAVEIGGGLELSKKFGSEIRDPIGETPKGIRPLGNRHGGILGGMSSGLPLFCEISFHAPTSIPQAIDAWDMKNHQTKSIIVGGRHDAFPLPRAIPMVEAMTAITLVDLFLRAGRIPEKL